MGYYMTYSLKLRIPAKDVKRALDIFNHLHTDEMLKQYARGGSYPPTDIIQDCLGIVGYLTRNSHMQR